MWEGNSAWVAGGDDERESERMEKKNNPTL